MRLQRSTRDRVVQLLLDQKSSEYQVDFEKLAEVLEYSSRETLGFLKSVNAEFGTRLIPADLENVRGKDGLTCLLAHSRVGQARNRPRSLGDSEPRTVLDTLRRLLGMLARSSP